MNRIIFFQEFYAPIKNGGILSSDHVNAVFLNLQVSCQYPLASISMHLHLYQCTCIYINALASISMHLHLYQCTCIYINALASISMHLHLYQCTCIYINEALRFASLTKVFFHASTQQQQRQSVSQWKSKVECP